MKKALVASGVFILNAFAVISYYMAFEDIKKAVLWSLPVLIISLLVIIGSLCCQLKSLREEIQAKEKQAQDELIKREETITRAEDRIKQFETEIAKLEKRTEALILQNKNQRKKILFIEENWKELNQVFLTALQKTEKDRFKDAYKLYLIKSNSLFLNDKEVI